MDDAEDNCQPEKGAEGPPAHLRGGDEADRIVAALAYLRGVLRKRGESSGAPSFAREEEAIVRWASDLDLLLVPDAVLPKLRRGGMEHDIFLEDNRVFKATRHGVFGFSPGIELALVSSSQDPRRFHLWEATPVQYLERLRLLNQLVPDLNRLEGVVRLSPSEISILTSQPALSINPVSEDEIDSWFESLGFRKLTSAAYYRADDNLGIFDAHDKNVIRAGGTLVPFDVIPCHPQDGFLEFIRETFSAGHSLKAVRTTRTAS